MPSDHPQPLVRHRGRGRRRFLRVGLPELEDHARLPLRRGRPARGGNRPDRRLRARRPALHRDQRRPRVPFSEAISLHISCADQQEVDHYWSALSEGGDESQCGWLKDRYGLSWQVIPKALYELLGDPDPARAERAMQAMLTMRKLDVAALRAAADAA